MPKPASTALPTTGPPPLPAEFAIVSRPNAAPRRPGGVTSIRSDWIAGLVPPCASPTAVRRTSSCQTEPADRVQRREDGCEQQAADQRDALAEPLAETTRSSAR